jgi:hypothetical protein
MLHKPSWKKELREVRDGLAKLEVQSILFGAFGPVLLHDDCLMFVQHVGGDISNVWLFFLRDLPHTYSCTCFIQQKKQKWNKQELYRFEYQGA